MSSRFELDFFAIDASTSAKCNGSARSHRIARMPRAASPAFVEPMAAKVVSALPEGDQWVYEVKWDGYRALLRKQDGHVQIRSRNNKDLTTTYPGIATALSRLRAKS